jgi:CubicO group peptidase (beta-lactamase class C family)
MLGIGWLQTAILALVALIPISPRAADEFSPQCGASAAHTSDLPVGTPAGAGFDAPALCAAMTRGAEAPINLHSLLVARGGHLVAEIYRTGPDKPMNAIFTRTSSFGPQMRHDMRSISKSVVGLLAGILAQEGKFPSLDSSVLAYFPDIEPDADAAHRSITIAHLLTMSSGLEWREAAGTYGTLGNDETHLFWTWSPVRYVMQKPMAAPPGTRFNYSGGDTAVIADLLAQGTGQTLPDIARTRLFVPLGIVDWEWLGDLWGRPVPFAGLRLRPRDLLKIGMMLLDNGQWQGHQIVPAAWIEASFGLHMGTREGAPTRHYGYFWWTDELMEGGHSVPYAVAVGNGGQRLFLAPKLDLAVAMTAGAYNDAGIGRPEHELFRAIVSAAATPPSTRWPRTNMP